MFAILFASGRVNRFYFRSPFQRHRKRRTLWLANSESRISICSYKSKQSYLLSYFQLALIVTFLFYLVVANNVLQVFNKNKISGKFDCGFTVEHITFTVEHTTFTVEHTTFYSHFEAEVEYILT
ncbi:unnamed protein product [Brugia timori]|uniref:Transmembrane protein n=1 Tax=Brugia timori TaxID=42155 RepID=A0A0R3R1N0_9BILA|nr:unnamed protein product [Brugia timori]